MTRNDVIINFISPALLPHRSELGEDIFLFLEYVFITEWKLSLAAASPEHSTRNLDEWRKSYFKQISFEKIKFLNVESSSIQKKILIDPSCYF